MPPGSRLLAFASRWFDEQTVVSVFQPLVADWQHESAAATGGARVLANVRGRLAFATAFAAAYPQTLRLPNPPAVTRRIVIRIAVFCAILTVLGLVPLFQILQPMWTNADRGLLATMVLVPIAALVTAVLPFAMAVGVNAIRGDGAWPPHVERRITTRLILATTLWMFVGGGWMIPALNHAWRKAVVTSAGADGAALARDPQDLSTGELLLTAVRPLRKTEQWSLTGSNDNVTVRGRVITERFNQLAARELAMRLSLVALPGMIAWMRWRTLEHLRSQTFATANRPLPFRVILLQAPATFILGLQLQWQSGLPYPLPIRHLVPAATVLVMVLALLPMSPFKRKVSARN